MGIKNKLKNSKVISPAIYRLRRSYYGSLQKRYGSMPIDKSKILFSNFNGRGYGCNPKAIAEEMHRLRPDYELVWICNSQKARESLPSYVTPVDYLSKEFFMNLATAGTWVFNLTLQDYVIKREGQFYIQTWHGDRAFKKILRDAEELDSFKDWMKNVKLREDELCDCCMSASDFGTRIYRSSFLYNGWVMEEGQPRNDVLVYHDSEYASQIRASIKVDNDVKVLLYAPTFRDHLHSQEASVSDIQLNVIVDELEKTTGSKWVVLLRAHGGTKLNLPNKEHLISYIDVTDYPDMADLLVITDFLITDYSSCAPDFALTGKPIMLYQDDIAEYVSKDRTMWFKMEESPYIYAHTMDEAIETIRKMTPQLAEENDRDILDFYGTKETGRSSQAICEEIIKRMER